jgi:hypothetical protein
MESTTRPLTEEKPQNDDELIQIQSRLSQKQSALWYLAREPKDQSQAENILFRYLKFHSHHKLKWQM